MRRSFAIAVTAALLATASAWSQDQATEVAPLEARGRMVPVPKVGEGAPYYSSEQLQSERRQATRNAACIRNATRGRSSRRTNLRSFYRQSEETLIASLARKADVATLAAEETRKRAADGRAAAAEVERAELARQAAVRRFDAELDRDFGLGYDPVIDSNPPVAIDVASARIREENNREVLVVAGEIQNIRNGRTMIPAITLAVYDLEGNLMMATAARPTSATLREGETKPFALKVPAWKDAARVEVKPGVHAPFMGDRDYCRPRAGASAYRMAEDYRTLQDDLRFNRPPGAPARPTSGSATIARPR